LNGNYGIGNRGNRGNISGGLYPFKRNCRASGGNDPVDLSRSLKAPYVNFSAGASKGFSNGADRNKPKRINNRVSLPVYNANLT
jgi:hypothetical protein